MDPTSDLDATTIWWLLYTRAEAALTAKKKDDLSSHCKGTRRKATSRNWKLAALDFHYTIFKGEWTCIKLHRMDEKYFRLTLEEIICVLMRPVHYGLLHEGLL